MPKRMGCSLEYEINHGNQGQEEPSNTLLTEEVVRATTLDSDGANSSFDFRIRRGKCKVEMIVQESPLCPTKVCLAGRPPTLKEHVTEGQHSSRDQARRVPTIREMCR